MVALTDLIVAQAGEYDEMQRQFKAERVEVPSDAEVLTAALRDWVGADGTPVLAAGEYADLDDTEVVTRRMN
ncbi:hypothetical protein [Massilia sp. X63]|uniref:hypothetical protein n=1 Tax=Massilia sp. X63 TaxID=3237285 RepID=UPI0034DD50B8